MTTFTGFFDEVLPNVPGCIEAVAEKAIRDASIEFCRKTWVWQVDHSIIPLVANQKLYALTPPADTYVVEILKPIRCNDKEIWARNREELAGTKIDEWSGPNAVYLLQEDERTVRVLPIPTVAVANGLSFRIAVTPTETATSIETRIYQEYREAIAYGALARLMFQPKKPYSDPDRAGINQGFFLRAIKETWNRVQRSYSGIGDIRFTL